MKEAGYKEVEHTADWALSVWGPNLPALLEQAAKGMNALTGVKQAKSPRKTVELQFPFRDAETLLVDFLSELLYLAESENIAFDSFDLVVGEGNLHARLEGAEIIAREKEIKAVTFHHLSIRDEDTGLKAEIVFDV